MKPTHAPSAGSSTSSDPAVETALHSLDRAVAAGSAERIARNLGIRHRRRQRQRIGLGTAAACTLIVVFLLRALPTPEPVSPSNASALVVAPLTRILPDGSTVEMKPGAQFDVEFAPVVRRIMLRAGEAHFAVQKDPARPFVVVAGDVEVRAVGTAFSIDLSVGSVAVLVTEGRVLLTTPTANDAPGGSQHLLDAGTRAVVPRNDPAGPTALIAAVTAAETTAHLEWRVRRLEFAGTPLAEALPMFNRHAGTRLALDPALGALRLSGALRADDLDALLLLLQSEFGIVAEPQNDGTVALRRRLRATLP